MFLFMKKRLFDRQAAAGSRRQDYTIPDSRSGIYVAGVRCREPSVESSRDSRAAVVAVVAEVVNCCLLWNGPQTDPDP